MPLGRELGNLRGAAAAIRSLLSSQRPESQELEEIRSISSSLSTIRFSDIAPHDFEAEQHAKEHLGFDDPTIVKNTDSQAEETVPRDGVKDITELKERLALLSVKLGLPLLA